MNNKNIILIGAISFIIFLFILIVIMITGKFFGVDSWINGKFLVMQSTSLIEISKAIAFIFDTASMIVISFIIALILFIKKYKKEAIFFASAMIVNGLVILVLKELIQRARPENLIESGFAFPSGHATTAVVFFGLLVYLAFRHLKNETVKMGCLVMATFMILIIGLSRIYLGVHWFSDVLGGWLLGLGILIFGIILFEKLND